MAKEDIIRKGRDIREVAPKKRIVVSSEITYILAVVLLALAVAILTAADLGISMIVAPAYLLSLKTGVVTFGQAEYIIQAGVFILLCLVIRRFRPVYLMSFVTCLVYGAVLDLWRMLPCFDPSVTAPGSMALWLRIPMFIVGVLLTSFAVALFFKTYLYPQVEGLGWGTLVMALLNGTIIGFFSKQLDRAFEFRPYLKKFAAHFELSGKS